MEYIEFFKEFPLLPPQSLHPLKADGYIETTKGTRIHVCIDVVATDNVYCIEAIKSTPEVEKYLREKEKELCTRFNQCSSALSFVKELQHTLSAMSPVSRSGDSRYYRQIFQECEDSVGWDCIDSYDAKAEIMVVKQRDDSGRNYNIYVNFANETFSSDVEEKTTPLSMGLSRYMESQSKICTQFAECWSVLDQVDNTLCVLHPQYPKHSDLTRRIALSNLATALFEVTPQKYHPRLVIYGPSSIAIPMNLKAKNTRNMWTDTLSVKDNLENILGIEVPEKEQVAGNSEGYQLECGICLSYELGEETADQLCTNDICARPFHRQCLLQWLSTKEDTRQSYNTYFGKCPYCSGNIVVSTS